MGAKGVNNAAHPPEGGLAEARCLSASSLPLVPLRSLDLNKKKNIEALKKFL